MRCDRAREAVQEALLGRPVSGLELAAALSEEGQRHLEGCAACREAAQELLALDRMLGDTLGTVPEMPPDLVASVMLVVERPVDLASDVTHADRESRAPSRSALAAAAAVLVLATLGLLVNWPVLDVSPAVLDAWTACSALAWDAWTSLQAAATDVVAPLQGLSLGSWADPTPASVLAAVALMAAAGLAHWGLLGSARHA